MEEVLELDGVEVWVESSMLTPETHWENRHEIFLQVKHSRAVWKNMTNEEREAIVKKVAGSLYVMADTVENWIPDSFTGERSGDALKIELTLAMAEIDTAVSRNREASLKSLSDARDVINQMIEDMD